MTEQVAAVAAETPVTVEPVAEPIQEVSAEGTPEVVPPVVAKLEAKLLRKLRLKVDKQEYDEELPFDIPDDPKAVEYMTRQLQMAKMGQKRAQDYAELEKDVVKFINKLRENPEEALSDPSIGIDTKRLAAKIIEKEIADAQKSPEQRDKEKLEAEIRKIKGEREKEKEDYQQKEFQRLQDQEFNRYDMEISDAISKSDLPKSPYVLKKVTEYLMMGLQNNLDVDAKDVIPLVREEIMGDLKSMFAVLPTEVIEALVGKDTISKIRKKNLVNSKNKPPIPIGKSVPDVAVVRKDINKKEEKKITYKDMFGF